MPRRVVGMGRPTCLALVLDEIALACFLAAVAACGGKGDEASAPASPGFQRAALQAYVKASDTDVGDQFGFALALDGDTLAVGAPGESSAATGVNGEQGDNSAAGSGAVYVFVRDQGTWRQQAYLKASNADYLQSFGRSVALSGDTLAVGAPSESSGAKGINGDGSGAAAPSSGAAYVFVRRSGRWIQQAYIKASNAETDDGFGSSIAVSGDVLAVGAPREDSSATGIDGAQNNNTAPQSGAAFIFARTNDSWIQQAYVKASNAESSDAFGTALALSGQTLAVGAPGERSGAKGINGDQADNTAPGAGAVYLFTRDGVEWSQQAYVKGSDTDDLDAFGSSVALTGETLAVGAVMKDGSRGAVYVFGKSGGRWSQQGVLTASNAEPLDAFGLSLALTDERLVVGAPREWSRATGINGDSSDNSARYSGAAYVFVRRGSGWAQAAYVKASNTAADDGFGYSVALSGDTLAAGAPYEASGARGGNGEQADNSKPGSGAVYVYGP